jgi:hypothetical protein
MVHVDRSRTGVGSCNRRRRCARNSWGRRRSGRLHGLIVCGDGSSGGYQRRRNSAARLPRRTRQQVGQQRCHAIVMGAGGLGHRREIGEDRREAVLTASLEKSYQVSYQVVPTISRSRHASIGWPSRRCCHRGGVAGGVTAGGVAGFGVTAVACAAATTFA